MVMGVQATVWQMVWRMWWPRPENVASQSKMCPVLSVFRGPNPNPNPAWVMQMTFQKGW